MISVKNLSKKFGHINAVDNISFQVNSGEIVGFLGPNGAGKTTTMKMLTGYLTPSEGVISICNHDLATDLKLAQKEIGYLPEGAPLYDDLTPYDFLQFIGRIRGIENQELDRKIHQIAEKVNILNILQQPIETLSKGYKRRVGIAQALIHDPRILILDEPTDGLDPNQKHEIRGLIKSISKSKAILISTHILEEVEALCSRVMIIAKGKIIHDSTPSDLIQKHTENITRLLFKTAFSEDKIKLIQQGIEGLPNIEKTIFDHEKPNGLDIYYKDDLDIAKLISLFNQDDQKVVSIYPIKPKLDSIFRDLTQNV